VLLASIWLLNEGVCAEWVGGVLLASDLRRSCGYSLGREHMSALGMALKMRVETIWCYAGQHLAAPDGGAACSCRRIRGVVVCSAFGMTLKVGVETLWCYAGQHLVVPEGVSGVGPWVGGVLLVSDSRRSCVFGLRDDFENGRGNALVQRWT
jgi:hypothetical protein